MYALPRRTCISNTSSIHRHHVHMTQKRGVRVSGERESERYTLERSSRDGCCLGEGSALTLLSMSGPDRLRSAPTTQSQLILLLLSDRFSCARGACDEYNEKTKRVCRGAQSPPPDVHATLVRLLVPRQTPTKLAGRQPSPASVLLSATPHVAGCGEGREVVAGGDSHLGARRRVCRVLFPAAHAATRRWQCTGPSKQAGIGGTIWWSHVHRDS